MGDSAFPRGSIDKLEPLSPGRNTKGEGFIDFLQGRDQDRQSTCAPAKVAEPVPSDRVSDKKSGVVQSEKRDRLAAASDWFGVK